MSYFRSVLYLTLGLMAAMPIAATTWNEPWQKQVIADASSFGLFEILKVDGSRAKLRTLKTLAGVATPEKFDIDGYYLLSLSSKSEGRHDEAGLAFSAGDRAYLYPKLSGKRWQLPTASSGIAVVGPNGDVAATYRISFDQAWQPSEPYERVQSCIFRKLHGSDCEDSRLADELDTPLHSTPVALSATSTEDDKRHFFAQHVALESAYLLGRSLPVKVIEPFLQSNFFHQQISAVRALAASRDPERNARMLAFLIDHSRLPVAQTMLVKMAKELGDQELIDGLKAVATSVSDAESRLPLHIMDPRVGTAFPESPRAAIEAL